MIAETLAMILDGDVLARIGGSIGDAARERQRELAKLDENAARGRRASWLAAARVPVPPDLRGIDRSWIDAAIETLGHDALARKARRLVLDGAANAGEVWLARWVCAAFPPLPVVVEIARPRSMADAARMSGGALRAWLEEVGADQIAFAVGGAATSISSRLGAAAERITRAPRLGELGDRRAAIARARITIDEGALLRVGARTIGPLASPLERLQVAYRLPRSSGVLAEMEAFAGSTGSPSWRALAAT